MSIGFRDWTDSRHKGFVISCRYRFVFCSSCNTLSSILVIISSWASLPTFSLISCRNGSSFFPRLGAFGALLLGPSSMLLPFSRLALLFVSVLSTAGSAVIVAQLDLLPMMIVLGVWSVSVAHSDDNEVMMWLMLWRSSFQTENRVENDYDTAKVGQEKTTRDNVSDDQRLLIIIALGRRGNAPNWCSGKN